MGRMAAAPPTQPPPTTISDGLWASGSGSRTAALCRRSSSPSPPAPGRRRARRRSSLRPGRRRQTPAATTLQRALDRRLYLLVKGAPTGAPAGSSEWHFPEKEYSDEGTMRKCAEAALAARAGSALQVYFVGNAPCGHTAPPTSPSRVRAATDLLPDLGLSVGGVPVSGRHRFFFRAQMLGGSLRMQESHVTDYAWVTKAELPRYIGGVQHEYLEKLLIG
eukprot:SM000117S25495  [mRNA]  locus=s117:155098:156570:- [translate_table: standard]